MTKLIGENQHSKTVYTTITALKNHICMEGLPRWPGDKVSASQCRSCRRRGSIPGGGGGGGWISWRRKWQHTVAFLPEKSHWQRSLEGYSAWSCKQLDTTERLSAHICMDKC